MKSMESKYRARRRMSNEINNPDFTFWSMKGASECTWVHLVMFDPMHSQLRRDWCCEFFFSIPSLTKGNCRAGQGGQLKKNPN